MNFKIAACIRLSILLILVSNCFVYSSTLFSQDIEESMKSATAVVDDNFDREAVGKSWWVNDERAQRTSKIPKDKFKPQVNISDKTLQIRRTEGSDHATSARLKAKFTDAIVQLKFRLTGKNKFGFNINDPNCKSVHAGHICRVEIGPTHVMIQDQKTGNMDQGYRKLRAEGASKEKLAAMLVGKSKRTKTDVTAGKWHDLTILLRGKSINVHIDNKPVAKFSSPGIGHPTKENIAFAVPKSVDVDDLKIWSIPPSK